ncbi:MAG: hypothetical protein ACI9SQ_000295 [Rubritalea sp.]|jgi:hypothetical protein
MGDVAQTVTSKFESLGIEKSSFGTRVAGRAGCHFLVGAFSTATVSAAIVWVADVFTDVFTVFF